MSFNGTGTYVLPTPQYPAVSNTVIYADDFNVIMEDLAAALSICITVDGQAVLTNDIPMANHKFTGLSAGSATGHSAEYSQVFVNGVFTGAKANVTLPDGTNDLSFADASWVKRISSGPIQNPASVLYAYLHIPAYP